MKMMSMEERQYLRDLSKVDKDIRRVLETIKQENVTRANFSQSNIAGGFTNTELQIDSLGYFNVVIVSEIDSVSIHQLTTVGVIEQHVDSDSYRITCKVPFEIIEAVAKLNSVSTIFPVGKADRKIRLWEEKRYLPPHLIKIGSRLRAALSTIKKERIDRSNFRRSANKVPGMDSLGYFHVTIGMKNIGPYSRKQLTMLGVEFDSDNKKGSGRTDIDTTGPPGARILSCRVPFDVLEEISKFENVGGIRDVSWDRPFTQ
jgi:hypothetical protein